MANEFKIKKGLIVDGDSTFSGSLESTQAVTASFFTGSFSGDGTNLTGITATPAGSDTQVQFNNAGALGADGGLTFDSSTNTLSIGESSNKGVISLQRPSGGYRRGYLSAENSGMFIGNDYDFSVAHMWFDYTGPITIGNGVTSLGASLGIKGSGTTSATTALLAQDSAGTDLLKVRDDGLILGNSTVKFGHSLDIERSGPSINFKTTDNAVSSGLVFINSGGSVTARIYHTPDTGKIDFWPSNGGSKMNLTTDGLELTGSLTVSGSSADLTVIGDVGIGTTSPAEKLHIFNTGYPQMALESNGGIWQVGVGSGNDLGFRKGTSGSDYPLWLDSSSNVGIGQTSPTARLNIKGSGATSATTALLVENSSGTDLLKVTDDGLIQIPEGLQHMDDSDTGLYFPSNDTISLKINNTEALHINNSRNIGIGTTSPESGKKLHVVGKTKIQGDLNLEGDLDFRVINSSGFGQPGIELPNFIDTFWRADRRFTVSVTGGQTVSGIAGLFDGTYSNLINFAASSTHVITINVANQSGVSVNGFTYPQGYIYFSFYSGTNDYDSISGRVKDRNGNYNSMSGLTDIISNDATYKVMRLTVPANNYAVEFELTLVTNTNNVRLSTINYVSTRHTSQMELPYLAKTNDTNRLFGNIDVLTNTGGDQNRLSGTGDSYLAVDTGDVGIGTSSPVEKLTVEGNISGSGDLTIDGTFNGDGSGLTGITAEWDGSHNGDAEITGSLVVSGSSVELGVEGRVNVSEGTTNRSIQLRDDGLYMSRTSDGGNVAQIRATSNGNNIDVRGQTGINLNISTNNALRIDGSRNVGIGAGTTPSARLHVKGSGTTDATTALLVENSSGTDLFKIEDGGNVGIGTTSTTAKLNVDGGISTSGTSGDIDSSRSFILSTLGTNRGGIYSDQILTGDVGKSLDDVVLYSANGAIHLTEGTVTNKVLTVSGSSVGIGTDSPDEKLHVVGNAKITGGVTGSSFTGSFVGDGSGLTGIGGGTPGGSDTQIQFNDGGAFGGDSNLTFNGTILTVGTPISMESVLKETFTASSLPSSTANVIAALDYSGTSRVGMFFDYVVIDNTGNMRAGTVMVGTNGTNITFTDNSTADIGSTTGVTWSAVLNTGNQTVDLTLTTPATGAWSTTIYVKSI